MKASMRARDKKGRHLFSFGRRARQIRRRRYRFHYYAGLPSYGRYAQ